MSDALYYLQYAHLVTTLSPWFRLVRIATASTAVVSTLWLLGGRWRSARPALRTREGRQKKYQIQLFFLLAVICAACVATSFVVPLRKAAHNPEAIAFWTEIFADGKPARPPRSTTDELRLIEDWALKKFPVEEVPDTWIGLGKSRGRAKGPVEPDVWSFHDESFGRNWLSSTLSAYMPFHYRVPAVLGRGLDKDAIELYGHPVHFWWVQQRATAYLVWSMYLGYQSRLHALPRLTPILFLAVSSTVGLAAAQCLFHALILLSPASEDIAVKIWTPRRSTLLVPALTYMAAVAVLPDIRDWDGSELLHLGCMIPAYFASIAGPWIGKFSSFVSPSYYARRDRMATYAWIALFALVLHIATIYRIIWHTNFDILSRWSLDERQELSWRREQEMFTSSRHAVTATLKMPAGSSVVSLQARDVLLSMMVMVAWTVVEHTNPADMLRSSLIPWLEDETIIPAALHPAQERAKAWLQAVQQSKPIKALVQFARPNDGTTSGTAEVLARRRGRSHKHRKSESANESGYSVRNKSKSRSPGRRERSRSRPSTRSAFQDYVEERHIHRTEVAHHEVHETAADGEAAGLTFCLWVLGGLGVASAGVMGGGSHLAAGRRPLDETQHRRVQVKLARPS